MKKVYTSLCFILLFLLFSGCSAIIETSTTQIRPVESQTINMENPGEFISIHHQDDLTLSIWTMLDNHTETQRFRIHHLQGGNGILWVNNAIQEIMASPLGAFGVSTIIPNILAEGGTLTEIELSIVYARTQGEIAAVLSVHDSGTLSILLAQALRRGDPFLAVHTPQNIANISFLESTIGDIFHTPGFDIIAFPQVEIHLYPSFTTGNQRIAEIQLDFHFSPSEIFQMRTELQSAANSFLENMPEYLEVDQQVLWLAQNLSPRLQLISQEQQEEDPLAPIYHTAYNALVHGQASSQGIALLTHGLLSQLGIESYLILGSINEEEHAWNLLQIGNYFFHIDMSAFLRQAPQYALFLSDETMLFELGYNWDMLRFPRADSPLTYFDFH